MSYVLYAGYTFKKDQPLFLVGHKSLKPDFKFEHKMRHVSHLQERSSPAIYVILSRNMIFCQMETVFLLRYYYSEVMNRNF